MGKYVQVFGVYLLGGRNFRCSFEEAKKKFYSLFNAVYGKIGCCASEEMVLNLLNTKCMSAMLYDTEACPVMSRHKHSLDFAVNRVFNFVVNFLLLTLVVSVAQLVARWTHDRKVVGSIPTNAVCFTVDR